MNADEIRKLCNDAIEEATGDGEDQDDPTEPLDFGGNQDDALSYGRMVGAAALAREILKNL